MLHDGDEHTFDQMMGDCEGVDIGAITEDEIRQMADYWNSVDEPCDEDDIQACLRYVDNYREEHEKRVPEDLNELFERMKNDDPSLPEWDSLPVFSDNEIVNTSEIWSWDDTNMIVGTCSDDIKIVGRIDIYEKEIYALADSLKNGFALTDAYKNHDRLNANDDFDVNVYRETAQKINDIESKYTQEEIENNSLLVDLW